MSEQDVNVPISAERLLAAFLKNLGPIEVTVDALLEDYSEYRIAVNQEKDGFVEFSLVDSDEES